MAKLLDCGTIFSIGLAVNAVIPTLVIYFRRTHQQVARFIDAELSKVDPKLAIGEADYPYFLQFVKEMSSGLKFTDKVKYGVIAIVGASLIVCFVGLVLSATDPEYKVANKAVWAFSTFTLLLCPGLVIGFEAWCRFLERALLMSLRGKDGWVEVTAANFYVAVEARRSVKEMQDMLEKGRPKFEQLERATRKVKKDLLRYKVKSGLARVFPWVNPLT